MQTVWPRCPKCGRRWRAVHAACGTEVAPPKAVVVEQEPFPELEGLVMERLLGRGGFGSVYLARRASDGTKVAVKVPTPEPDPIMRLELEGQTLRALAGTHAPALYDEPRLPDGRPCLVMEFVAMPTLDRRLDELENGMPFDEFARRGLSILEGLRAFHDLGLVHRDLKPENIFSTDQPTVTRIFDFGLVKTPAEVPQQQTNVGTFMGTPEYMAPEQLDSSAPVDQRADHYAIGAVFYEMLAGRPPFWGNAAEVQQALANRRAQRPSRYVPGVPRPIEEVILRCLAKDSIRRYPSTAELIAAFAAAVEESSRLAATPAASPPAATDTSGKPAVKPDAKAKESSARRPMAVVAVRGIAVDALMKALASGGGQLAEVGRTGGVGVFGEKTSENPVRRAIRFADALLGRKACKNVIIDVTSVAVRKKPDGGERYVSAAFARLQKQLDAMAADGLFLTAAAGDLVPDRRGEATSDGALWGALPPPRDDETLTVVRASQAPLVGRAEEMGRLLASARGSALERRPGLATIIADGGLGKSHLAAGLVEELRGSRPAPNIFEMRAREPIDGESEGNLRTLLGRCFPLPDEKPADRGEALLGELGPTLWPAAALALGWMTPDAPELSALGAAPGVLRSTQSRAVGEALRRRAREGPLALIIDDAHFADDVTLEAIEYATMTETAAPLWVCVLARPGLAQMKPTWGERSAAHLRLNLGPLAAEAAADLARRLLQPVESIPAAALDTLVAGTHGNPFLLSELVRGLKRDGIVRQDPKTGLWFVATDELARLPDLAVTDWLAEREIGAMPPELVAHARLSALLGTDFSEDEIEGIINELERAGEGADAQPVDPDLQMDPHVATRQLLSMGVFKRQRNGRAAFRHSLLRAAVEKSVSDKQRSAVHAAAFRYYRAATGIDEPTRLPRLALHAAGAGYSAEAAPLYLDLADRARHRHAYIEAETLYSRALGHLEAADLRRRMVALRGRGSMRSRVNRRDAADDLLAALAAARDLQDRRAEIEILLDAASAYDWMLELRRSRELVVEADTLLAGAGPEVQNELLQASVLVAQGRSLWRFSEGKPAIEKLQQGNEIAGRLGDEAYEIRVVSLLLLGDLLPYHGRVDEAERVWDTVLSLCETHNDQVHRMVSYLNRRQLWIGKRDLERALDDSRRCIQIAREIGSLVVSFMGEYNLGELLYQSGDCDAAWPHVRRAIELEQKGLSGLTRPLALLLEARLFAFLGRNAEARDIFDKISASQSEAERVGQSEGLLVPSERVLLSLVDLSTRDSTVDEWQQIRAAAEASSIEMEQIEVAEMAARTMFRHGHVAEAREVAETAAALGVKIPNVMANRLKRLQAEVQSTGAVAQAG